MKQILLVKDEEEVSKLNILNIWFVFCHQPFDYLTENAEVMKRVEKLAWNFDPKTLGFEWNEGECQDYQRHYPEVLGYQVLRPVRKIV